jgi:hypothetical protein|tara:strand:- start:626 stop:853 length:228 start_codon:yes stop_codon:yes gene_type:complete
MKRGIEVTIRANLNDENYQVIYDPNPEKATELNIIDSVKDNIEWAIIELFNDLELFTVRVKVDREWREGDDRNDN